MMDFQTLMTIKRIATILFACGSLSFAAPDSALMFALNVDDTPFSLAKGQRWTLRYSLAVLSTPADHARLAKIVAAFKSKNS
jgi:hypothetical protein